MSSTLTSKNEKFTPPFIVEEFKEAMISMSPEKCSRSNGFSMRFYQHLFKIYEVLTFF